MVNDIIINKTGKGLNNLQVGILEGIFDGKTYSDMTDCIKYQEQTIKNEASNLFKLLNESGKIKEEVNKGNMISVFKRYKGRIQHSYNNQDGSLDYPLNKGKTQKEEQLKLILIEGRLDDIDETKLKALVSLLQKKGKDISIEIVYVEEGSIRITIKGTEEGLARLQELFNSGELNSLEGFEVLEVRDLNEVEQEKLEAKSLENAIESSNLAIDEQLSEKEQLVKAIQEGVANKKNLRGINLSDANLRGADLRGASLIAADLSEADLSGADLKDTQIDRTTQLDNKWRKVWEIVNQGAANQNLSGADLSRANLRGANLRGAILIAADLNGANLSRTNLSGANLNGADLSGANVESAKFVHSLGISDTDKDELKERGAIFDDAPGDRSPIPI